jgi:hypothetical protein
MQLNDDAKSILLIEMFFGVLSAMVAGVAWFRMKTLEVKATMSERTIDWYRERSRGWPVDMDYSDGEGI